MTRRSIRPRLIAPQSELDRLPGATGGQREEDPTVLDFGQITVSSARPTTTISKKGLATLGEALRGTGFPTPLPVRMVRAGDGTSQYVLIGGYRLYRAAEVLLAGGDNVSPEERERIRRVPVAIDSGLGTTAPMLALLTEVDRVKVAPATAARTLAAVKERSGWTNVAIGVAFGLSEGKVHGYVNVAHDAGIIGAVERGLNITVAIALARNPDQKTRDGLLDSWNAGARLTVENVTPGKTSSTIDDRAASGMDPLPLGRDEILAVAEERAAHLLTVTRICLDHRHERSPRWWETIGHACALMNSVLDGRIETPESGQQ